MAEQRLPTVGGDDGSWGTILNQYLEKEHYNTGLDNPSNGMHETVTIRAGVASAGGAPLKFTSGTNLTAPEAGAMEYNGTYLYFSPSTTRKTVAVYDDSIGAAGDVYYRDSGGNYVRLGIGSTGDVLTVASGLPSWAAPTGGNEYVDNVFRIKDNGDSTKKLAFEVSTISTATTRTLTVPDYDATIATIAGTETLTNKTLTAPKIADLGYIADANSNEYVIFDSVASAVNEITITNAATTTAPQIAATGGDTNVSLNVAAKGTGAIVAKSDLNIEDENVYFTEYDNGTKTGAFTVDWTVGQKQKVTINAAGPLTVTLTAPAGPCNLLLKIIQGSTPGTLSWPGTVKWPGGTAPTLSGSTNQVDIVSFYYDGTNYNGVANLNFS